MPVDHATYLRYLRASEKALANGCALVEMLDHDRLLLTEQRERQIKLDVAVAIYNRLKQKSGMDLLRVFNGTDMGTAGEMFEATKEWLLSVCTALEDNKWEES